MRPFRSLSSFHAAAQQPRKSTSARCAIPTKEHSITITSASLFALSRCRPIKIDNVPIMSYVEIYSDASKIGQQETRLTFLAYLNNHTASSQFSSLTTYRLYNHHYTIQSPS